jgi:glucose-6-phosphate isomerase
MVTNPETEIGSRVALLAGTTQVCAGELEEAIGRYRAELERVGFVQGLWAKRAELWSSEPEVQRRIENRLGWLESPERMVTSLPRLTRFADTAWREGIKHVVLLGMGGSSLAAEVMRAILGGVEGAPAFTVLDTTDPAAIRNVEEKISIAETLFLVSSKSGTTIEPNLLWTYFVSRLAAAGVKQPGHHLVAITDEGTPFHDLAERNGYREIFLNAADIGGRYSALSLFGLVPAALMGIDLGGLLAWGRAMAYVCGPRSTVAENPGVALGIVMGAAARGGRDKLTLIAGERLTPFGLWIEQLVAESTGKRGRGIVPVAGEPLGPPSIYRDDRLFVRLRLHSGGPEEERLDGQVERLRAAGFPLVTIDVKEPAAIGAEFVRWEIATATAGAILGVNPFDEPDVQRAKDATQALLERVVIEGKLPARGPQMIVDDLSLTFNTPVLDKLEAYGKDAGAVLGTFLRLLEKGDYVGLLAYLPFDATIGERIAKLRAAIRDRAHVATMFSYGPRYLHSTGQLHKGGPNTGIFVLFTADPQEDVAIPGAPYSFGTLELAQALGDFSSLEAGGRRAVRLHLPAPDLKNVERACSLLESVLPTT